MLPLFGVRRFGQPSSMVEPLPSGLINPMGLGGTPLNPACFSFTGSNYASVASISGLTITNGFTVSAWVRPAAVPEPNVSNRPLFSFYVNTQNHFYVHFPIKNTSNIYVYCILNNVAQNPARTVTITGGVNWQFFAMSYVGEDLTVWLNGSKTSTTLLNISTMVGTPSFNLGRYAVNFLGCVAGLSVIEGGITDGQEAALRAGGLPTDIAGCKAWYPYPSADGNVRDASGNGNHMTTTGGSLYSASGGPGLP